MLKSFPRGCEAEKDTSTTFYRPQKGEVVDRAYHSIHKIADGQIPSQLEK
jgi:hypothetical protein